MANHNIYPTESSGTHSSYNYKRVISDAMCDAKYEDFATYIDAKIKEHRNEVCDRFNRINLANLTGIGYEMLKKIINGSKVTRKRDCIIAICFALELDRSETNRALELYPMATLNPNNMRDLIIIEALANHEGIQELNKLLESCKFSRLNIDSKGNRTPDDRAYFYPAKEEKYTILQQEVIPYDIIGYEGEKSLSNLYNPWRFSYDSYMVVRRNDDGKHLKITADGFYTVYEQSDSGDYKEREYFISLSKCKDPELSQRFLQLNYLMDGRARQIVDMLNDTRNYGQRLSAEIIDDQLIIYGENFNYTAPELCEYYQIEMRSESCQFSVSRRSTFLQRYLSNERYSEYYGPPTSDIRECYPSLSVLESMIENEQHHYLKYILNQRLRHFKELQKASDDLVVKIQRRNVVICTTDPFNIEDIIQMFQVEKELDCVFDNEIGLMVPQHESFNTQDGTVITLGDLYRAIELGISSTEDIRRIKAQHGSLEALLKR